MLGRPTAVREDPGSNLTTAGRVYHDSHCDIQPWAWVVHPYNATHFENRKSILHIIAFMVVYKDSHHRDNISHHITVHA